MAKIRATDGEGFIETEQDLVRGVQLLRKSCPILARVHDVAGDPPLRRRQAGFEGIARIVVGQQLSVASAGAIWGRCAAAVQPFDAATLLATSDDRLRQCGLSRGKVRTLRAVAGAVVVDGLDLTGLTASSDADVHAALTAITGIGPWTADIYLMFCLGRADAFAAGDLALQIAAQHAAGLEARPDSKRLIALAERWRPWRAVAASLLWAYYPHIKTTATPVIGPATAAPL